MFTEPFPGFHGRAVHRTTSTISSAAQWQVYVEAEARSYRSELENMGQFYGLRNGNGEMAPLFGAGEFLESRFDGPEFTMRY